MLLKNGYNPDVHFYLQHGWGFKQDCFQKWSNHLSRCYVTNLDRGYWGSALPLSNEHNNEFVVLVCHSLGMHFFTQEQLNAIDMLVVLGGFANFHGLKTKNLISRKHIKRMQGRLKQESEELLKDFYRDCLWPGELPNFSSLNLDLLAEDLVLLDTVRFQHNLSKDTKIMILHGSNDRIVPLERARELQTQLPGSTLHEIDGAGHGLPFTHIEQCMTLINEQLSDCESK